MNKHLSAPPGELYWRYSLPIDKSAKMLLRTVGDVAVIGTWYGNLNEYFVAWCPLPRNSK
jgi:hypothetical protein